MKVCHVVRQFHPSIGGMENAVLELCKQLQIEGHEVTVVTLDRAFQAPQVKLPEYEVIENISVHRVPYFGSSRYPLAPRALAAIGAVDLIHTHAIDFFFDFLALARMVNRTPLVATTHGGFFHTSFAKTLKRLYFQTVTRCSVQAYGAICASSEADAETFQRIAGSKVVLVENGVNIDKFRNLSANTARRRLIFFGRFSSNKRVDLLFPMLRELNSRGAPFSLVIAGAEGEVSMDDLRRAAAQHGVQDAVEWVAAPSDEELGRLIGSATYFVSPSAYEGFGLAAIEAMSSGLVPVLSPIPTHQSFVERAGQGLIVDPLDPAAAADALSGLHMSLEQDVTVARSELVESTIRYSWGLAARRYLQVYGEVLQTAR